MQLGFETDLKVAGNAFDVENAKPASSNPMIVKGTLVSGNRHQLMISAPKRQTAARLVMLSA